VANDAEHLAMIFAKRTREKATQAIAWVAVQRAASRE
jgi:hypothetical protein